MFVDTTSTPFADGKFSWWIYRSGIVLDLSDIEEGTGVSFDYPLTRGEMVAPYTSLTPDRNAWPWPPANGEEGVVAGGDDED